MIFVQIEKERFLTRCWKGSSGSVMFLERYFGGSVLMPYFSFRSFNCSSFFFVSIFWKACKELIKYNKNRITSGIIEDWKIQRIKTQNLHKIPQTIFLFDGECSLSWRCSHILCLRCSRGPPGNGCRHWSLTNGHRRSWRQICPHTPHKLFLLFQVCSLWEAKKSKTQNVRPACTECDSDLSSL